MRRSEEALGGVEQRLHELEVESRAPGYVTIASMATEPTSTGPYWADRVRYGSVGLGVSAALAVVLGAIGGLLAGLRRAGEARA